MDWLVKALTSRFLWELLLYLGLNVLLDWAYRKRPELRARIQPALITLACTAVIWFALAGRPIFSPEPEKISEQNVESYVRNWLDDFTVSVQKQENDKFVFDYEVTAPMNANAGVKLEVAQRKQPHDKWLVIHAGIDFDGESKVRISNLNRHERDQIVGLMSIELAKSGVVYAIDPELKSVNINTSVPVTDSLNEDTFFREMEKVDNAVIIAENFVKAQLALREDSKPH